MGQRDRRLCNALRLSAAAAAARRDHKSGIFVQNMCKLTWVWRLARHCPLSSPFVHKRVAQDQAVKSTSGPRCEISVRKRNTFASQLRSALDMEFLDRFPFVP